MREYKGVALNKANVEWAVDCAVKASNVGNEMLEMAAEYRARAEEMIKNLPEEVRHSEDIIKNVDFVVACNMTYFAEELRRLYGKMMH